MPESLGSMYSSILMLENIWYLILSEVDLIHKRLWIFSKFIRVPGDPQAGQNSQFLVNSVHFI